MISRAACGITGSTPIRPHAIPEVMRSTHPRAKESESLVSARPLQLRRNGRPHVVVRRSADAARIRSEIRASPVGEGEGAIKNLPQNCDIPCSRPVLGWMHFRLWFWARSRGSPNGCR
ncbi:hypothetical protein [Methanothrix sp.]|uniref:hypothetical protein n=1 Tax=Methanothrix sp. TaxID=90426 RepID=UPI003C788A9E